MTTATRSQKTRARCCKVPCEKFAQSKGLCKAHGGGSRCRHEACGKLAQTRGLCIAHGGGRRCRSTGCTKLAQSKGFCIAHGGGRKCIVLDCNKFTQVKGRCKLHYKLLDQENLTASTAAIVSKPSIRPAVASPNSVASNFSVVMPIISFEQSAEDHEAAKAQSRGKLQINFLVNPMTKAGACLPGISALHSSCRPFVDNLMPLQIPYGRQQYPHEALGHLQRKFCVLDSPFHQTESTYFLKALSLRPGYAPYCKQGASEKRMQLPSLASLGMRTGCWQM
ncbi:unnamed protein product [Albugo candida]|uniref:WRKY19-like zinc finger domain-containing protein n=1 Tax=Albugo candida TaxID=65357 RepID=A0A024GE26_9STRA|nr:unnamed protein product [Albugo candida]|eukprot:CCI44904.1 unnamed protein product [Albugo candida]